MGTVSRKSVAFMVITYIYARDIWEAAVGEELNCKREPSNSVNRYTMAVVKGDIQLSVTYRKS